MQVSNHTFYVAELDGEMHLFDGREDAISHLKNTDDLDPESEDVAISEVAVDGEDWTIKQMPWQRIALTLLKDQ